MAFLYLARSDKPVLCKTLERADDGQINGSFKPGERFEYERIEVETLRDVFDALTRLVDDPHRAIVMGKPLTDSGHRKAEYFEDTESTFFFVDLDGVPIIGTVEETIVRCLPFLAGCAYIYAYTQSAGVKKGLRTRVVFKVKPLSAPDFEAHARHWNDRLCAFEGGKAQYIDSGIYAPSRLLLTARPRLLGVADPHRERVFMVEGDEITTLPDLPPMVRVTVGTGAADFSSLPQLTGTWGHGPDHDRSVHALKGIGRLKGYMGDEWNDVAKRTEFWHDMLRAAGAETDDFRKYGDFVNKRVKDARAPQGERTYLVHANPDNSVPLHVASKRLEDLVRHVITDGTPRVVGINVTMGAGKTHQILRQIGAQIRYHDDLGIGTYSIDYYVPTYEMAEELLLMAQAEGIDAFIEQGRGREGMCIKADSAEKLGPLVPNVAQHICNTEIDDQEVYCEHFHECEWQRQRRETQHIPMRIRVHDYLTGPVFSENHPSYRHVDLVVIDETSWVGDLLHNRWVEIKELAANRHDMFDWVAEFLKIVSNLTIEALEAAGFTEEVFRELIKREERPEIEVTPDISPAETWKAVEDIDLESYGRECLWRRMRDCMACRSLNRVRVVGDHLVLNWKSPITAIPWNKDEGRPAIPVLVLSGTMLPHIIEQFIKMDEYHEIDVAPHPDSIIVQSTYKGSKAEWEYGSTKKLREAGQTDQTKIKAAAAVRESVLTAAEDKALITNMGLEKLLEHDPSAHFNNIEGLNKFSGMPLVVYGRTLPHFRAIEDMARAIFDDDEQINEMKRHWYPRRRVARRGPGFAVGEYHPDERVEAVRWMVCEGEIMQALARSRYVREPVEVTILTGLPLPLRIDRVIPREFTHPQWRDFEKAKVLPLTQREYTRLWPEIWKDHRSAYRWARDNARQWREKHVALVIEYRIKGARGPKKKALVDGMSAVSELGDVVQCDLVDDPRNDWAVTQRELRDMLAREPMELEEWEMEAVAELEVASGRSVGFERIIEIETAGGEAWIKAEDCEFQWPWMSNQFRN